MGNVLLFFLYWIETAKYYVGYELFFGERLKRYFIPAAGAVIYSGFLFLLRQGQADFYFIHIFTYFFAVFIVWMVQESKFRQRIRCLLLLFFALNCFDSFVNEFIKLGLWVIAAEKMDDTGLMEWLPNFITLLCLTAFYIVKKRYGSKIEKKHLSVLQTAVMPLVLLVIICIFLTIALLDFLGPQITNDEIYTAILLLSAFSYLGMGMIGLIILYIRRANQRIRKLAENEHQLQELQRQYYESLLSREKDTRRYRHDLANHLLCLNSYAEEGNLPALRSYLEKMQSEFQSRQKQSFETGNHIFNILTSHYTGMLPPQVSVQVQGSVTLSADEMKLSTIYGNLLQNAVEELRRCGGKSCLKIQFEQGRQYCRITIVNSLSDEKKQQKRNLLLSDKDDAQNHGFGLQNVRKVLEEMKGILELKQEGDCFRTTVFLPLEEPFNCLNDR